MNAVEICNLALGRIGQGASNPIQSLTESSEAARACNRLFAPTMQFVLREHIAWPFARKAVALQTVAQTVPGWSFVYAYPNDCLRLHALCDEDTDPFRLPTPQTATPYKLMASNDGESLVIATDLASAWAWYTADVTNPHFADALFQDVLAWRMAMELALSLKADPRLMQSAQLGYRNALGIAAMAVAGEQSDDLPVDAENIRVR